MRQPSHVAVGSWSGGRFMHFGEPLDDERFATLLRPGGGIDTIITADVYGKGEADLAVGRALAGVPREDYCLVGAIGHDFYEGERRGAKGFPRLTDPALRGPEAYGDYIRMATERSLERCGVDRFDILLLHNPDRIGFTSEAVWAGMAAVRDEGLTGAVGVAPGPANGYVLDVIGCMERFSDVIDWGMVILNAFEPWPVEMVLPAAQQQRRPADHARRGLRRHLPRRRQAGAHVRRLRPPQLPAGGLGRAGRREARAGPPDRRAPRPHDAPVRLPVGPRAAGGRERGRRRSSRRSATTRARSRRSGPSWRPRPPRSC